MTRMNELPFASIYSEYDVVQRHKMKQIEIL
jgi:hypothetical protein